MKRFALTALIALAAASVALLPACTTAPTADQVTQIQTACAVDAGVRPTVTALLAIPGLATAQEIAGVAAARAVIDPICANPAGTPQDNALAALTTASGQVVAIVTTLQARKGAAAPAASAPTAK